MTEVSSKRPMPRWLRLLLMALLIAFAALAYWLNFGDIVDAPRPTTDTPGEGESELPPT